MKQLAAVVSFIYVVTAQAQPTCPTSAPRPGGIVLTKSCDPCLAGQAVTFTLVPRTTPCDFHQWGCPPPYTVQTCDTVMWNFGDNSGNLLVHGSPSVTHTFAAKSQYRVAATVTNSLAPWSTPATFDVVVGGNPPTILTISAPPFVSEAAAAALVTLTRSGDLSVPTLASYKITGTEGYTTRIAQAEGQVVYTPGETQKTLSFALINNDGVYTGPTTYQLEVASEDGTLLEGLQPYTPSTRAGLITTLDDEPRPHMRTHDVAIPEGTGGVSSSRFTATLDVPMGHQWRVYVSPLANLSDVIFKQYGLHAFDFAPGQLTATCDIALVADATPEPDEVISVKFYNYTDPNGPSFERSEATLTIVNDDIGFGGYELTPRLTVGETLTLPINIGNPLAAGETLTVNAVDPSVFTVVPSVAVGSATGEIAITGLRGGRTSLVAEVIRPAGPARGNVDVTVFQPSILVASPDALRLRAGEEGTMRVSFSPAQGEPSQVIVHSSSPGIVEVVSSLVTAPAGGDAVVTLRGVAPGKTSLLVFSLGQQHTTVVPVEVLPADGGRRRAARP
jgi:PKD repeat protein